MPTQAQETNLARWLADHGLTADDAQWQRDQGGFAWYAITPLRRGDVEVVGVRLTTRGVDPVERPVSEAPTVRATLRPAVTAPALISDKRALVDRCAAVIHADARTSTTSANDASLRLALAGSTAAGLTETTMVAGVPTYTPTALLLRLEGN